MKKIKINFLDLFEFEKDFSRPSSSRARHVSVFAIALLVTALVTTAASAALTLGGTSIVSDGALTLTGAAASTWDIGANTLSLQTTNNGAITTGTGAVTLGGSLAVTGNVTSGTWQGSTVDVQYGGTGATTFAANGLLYGNGTSALQATSAGTSGQFPVANASGVPTFVSMSGDATMTNAGVISVSDLTITSEAQGDVLYFDGTNWVRLGAGTNGQYLQTQGTGANPQWAAGGISNVVEDTTPQLGGMLDVNGFAFGDGTLELLKFTETASAVNEMTITNAAIGNAPIIAATGDDTNVGLTVTTQGTGTLTLDTGGAGSIVIGSGDVTSLTVTTNGTGDGEVVLPNDSIGTDEILDGTIAASDLSNTLCLQVLTQEASAAFVVESAIRFMSIIGGTTSATETDMDDFVVPTQVIAHTLRAEVDVAPGAGNDAWVLTLRDDAADTTLTCSIDETATTCTDTANTVTIAAGSKIDVEIDPTTGLDADPADAAALSISFCFGQ